MSASERTPLKAKDKGENPPSAPITSPTAYFLDGKHRRGGSTALGSNTRFSFYYSKDSSSRHTNEEIDKPPAGASSTDEFDSRPVSGNNSSAFERLRHRGGMRAPSVGGDWLSYIVDRPRADSLRPSGDDFAAETGEVGTLLIPRKVPIKVEPKVHFGNERTLLAWLHVVMTLAAASVTIVTFAEGNGIVDQLFGIVLLPVSVAYIFYALSQYIRRAIMIKHHEPGPYIDVAGPTVLTIIIVMTIIVQFVGKLHSVMNSE